MDMVYVGLKSRLVSGLTCALSRSAYLPGRPDGLTFFQSLGTYSNENLHSFEQIDDAVLNFAKY